MGRRFTKEKLKQIKELIQDSEELNLILEADDPVLWAENHLFDPDTGEEKIIVKKAFYDLLRSNKKNRAIRSGRQIGKTVHLDIDILHSLYFNNNYKILIFVPEKKHMNRQLEIIANMLRKSDLKGSFSMKKAKRKKKKGEDNEIEAEFDYEIQCSSGSVARFFFMGTNPGKARGQHASGIVYIDEAEYIKSNAYDVIGGYFKADPNLKVWASSTPAGLPKTWFRIFSENCANPDNDEGVEFHIPTSSEANWPEIEKRLRDVIFDEVTWNLEVLAEWADAIGTVYKKEVIDRATDKYKLYDYTISMEELRDTKDYKKAPKFIGVDWNVPQNGVRIVELVLINDKYYLSRHERISHEKYTQTYTVERILKLDEEYNYTKIALDAGYGETQLELIHMKLLAKGIDPATKMCVVDSGKKVKEVIVYNNPITGARKKDEITMWIKTYIISLLGRMLEENICLPEEEDMYINRDGVVSELRGFRRKEGMSNTSFDYTKAHSVSAFQICTYGINEWIKTRDKNQPINIGISTESDIKNIINNRVKNRDSMFNNITINNPRSFMGSRTGGLNSGRSSRSII